MKAEAWAVIAFASIVAAVGWQSKSRSKLALAITLVAATLGGLGLLFAVLGYGGCAQRGDCGPVGGTLRTVLGVAFALLPCLLAFALVRALLRRLAPRRGRPRGLGMRPRDIGLAICGTFLGITSISIAVSGGADDRLGAVTAFLFAVAMLCLPISGWVAGRSGLGPRLERVMHNGAARPALVLPGSLAKRRLMTGALFCFAAGCAVLAASPQALDSSARSGAELRVGGVLCALLFGGGALIGVLRARAPVRIELLPELLRWQVGASPGWIAWTDITGVRLFDVRRSWFLAIEARPGSVHIPRPQLLAHADRAVSHAEASISLELFPIAPERVVDVIEACARDDARRRQIGTEESLAWFTEAERPAVAGLSERLSGQRIAT